MNALEKYNYWLKRADAATAAELEGLGSEEIENRFRTDMKFGTGGIRGIIGAGTALINIYTIRKATKGFADYINGFGSEAANRGVVIAHDNRRKSEEFARTTAGVLAACGIKVYLFPTLHTTPQLSFAVRYKNAFGGVVITASHNPPEYNGYKLYDETGCQLVPRYTDKVIALIDKISDVFDIECDENSDKIEILDGSVDEAYYKEVEKLCHGDVDEKNFGIVYSPQHGTGAVPVSHMLKKLGYNVLPVEKQFYPDTEFSNTKNPNPETAEAFELPIEYAKEAGAELVIVTDPDCDRLGVAVMKDGKYVRMTGNQSGAVLLDYVLKRRKESGTLPENSVMISTIVTSDLGDRIAASYGVRTEKTLTGFKFIGDKIHKHETSDGAQFVFGYEESYGCLIGDFVRDKDGVQASVMLCEAAAYYRKQGKTLIDVLDEIYEKYGYTLDYLESITLKGIDGAEKIKGIMKQLRENPPKVIDGFEVVKIEDYSKGGFDDMPKADVLKIYFEGGSWVAVRPSGTEPKCKFYYGITAKDKESAKEVLESMKNYFHKVTQ